MENLNHKLTIDESIEILLDYYVQHPSPPPPEHILINHKGWAEWDDDNDKTIKTALQFLINSNIISWDSKRHYLSLMPEGYIINRVGGWVKYNQQKEADKQRERDNIEASIRTARLVEKNQGRQNLILFVTAVASIIAALATYGQWSIALQQEKKEPQKDKQRGKYHHCHKAHHHRLSNHTHDTIK